MIDKIKNLFEVIRTRLIIIIPLIIILAIFILPVCVRNTYTATVTDKGIKRADDTDKYLIYTDIGTFENTDELLCGKFNSSDIYGRIRVGDTYEFTVIGFRIPFLSAYQNIIEVKHIE